MLVFLLFFVGATYSQTVPYIKDMVGEEGVEESIVRGVTANGELRLFGTFKLFNPDTVPFYLWVAFENGGKFKHTRYRDEYPSVRLVDLELRYKNALQQPMVKKFPNTRYDNREKKRFGGSWLGGGRSGKGGLRGKSVEDETEIETERAGRGRGTSEVAFWKEDAQVYYEMELWGVLYAPDVRGAVVAGNYVENINFEIEPMR